MTQRQQPDAETGGLHLDPKSRYADQALLGRGGMGEVRLCHDRRIGRDVAMKRVRPEIENDAAHARFVREACIQGRLEHPSVVPVYDVGIAPDGGEYFTMKRIGGVTLESVVENLAARDAETGQRFGRRKLLTAFVSVCQAIELAHSRGYIHRDLKPANVMLGDFGEVYVLDWGLAKPVGEVDADVAPTGQSGDISALVLAAALDATAMAGSTPSSPNTPSTPRAPSSRDGTPLPDTTPPTIDGAILGTPGYMAPEQLRGQVRKIDTRSDVYALGAILFEVLALQPLHARTTVHAVAVSTLLGADARPSARSPEHEPPPELDAVCVAATQIEVADRTGSVRELREAVERFLDGDRDTELRRRLAADLVTAAQTTRLSATGNPSDEEAARAAALREIGRALALDPRNPDAMRVFLELLTAPSRGLPSEVEAEIFKTKQAAARVASRTGALAHTSWFIMLAFMAWAGVNSPTAAYALIAVVVGSVLVLVSQLRRAERIGAPPLLSIVAVFATIAVQSVFMGPLIVVPAITVAVTAGFMASATAKGAPWIAAVGVMTVVVPPLVEWAGWFGRIYAFENDRWIILPAIVHFPEVATRLGVMLASVISVVAVTVIQSRIRRSNEQANQQQYLLAWRLRHLVSNES